MKLFSDEELKSFDIIRTNRDKINFILIAMDSQNRLIPQNIFNQKNIVFEMNRDIFCNDISLLKYAKL